MPVERLNRLARILVIVHFDEAETARLPGKTVSYQRYVGRSHSCFSKPVGYVLFGSLKR
jgi:hypothetical protein